MSMNREAVEAVLAEPGSDAEKADRIIAALTDQRTIGRLWLILVCGLVAALLLSGVGVLLAVLDGEELTSPDVLITMFTTTSAGLLGLFVKSPTST